MKRSAASAWTARPTSSCLALTAFVRSASTNGEACPIPTVSYSQNTSQPLAEVTPQLLLLLFFQERPKSTLSHVSTAGDGRQGVMGAVRHPHGGGHRRLHPQPGRRCRPAAPAVAELTLAASLGLTGTRACCVSGLH